MNKRKRSVRRLLFGILAGLLSVTLLMGAGILAVNAWVIGSTEGDIYTVEELSNLAADCILVLGCGVNGRNPSHMLEDRLKVGVALYETGVSPKILMSGDHGQSDYNEVAVMKLVAMEAGVPSKDVFMDHAGFSTYDSLYRAREVFGAERVVIVSQGYHLYRALYIARELGLEAYGVASDLRPYQKQWTRELREMLARVKDVASGMLLPSPEYLGECIDLTGDGDVTNDADFDRVAAARRENE